MSQGPRRRPTSTSSFGVGRREGHDASSFYSRFTLPQISAEENIGTNPDDVLDRLYVGDSRSMGMVADRSVALVVTSPPYFAGKEYEQALGEGHVPGDYVGYLEMLEDVLAECRRVLEPGGRMAINVANLGRKPYRSLAADIIGILQDRLGLLLRGEVVWVKGQGASGSCAWGSFQSPANPVLRDLTERVIIASKGRFDRALTRKERRRRGLPSDITLFRDEFMEATTDVWEIVPESAQRVGHPAPFPPELPERLIHLYTYLGDTVLDPFVGSGSSAVAAVRTGRRFIGFDTDERYVTAARSRIDDESRPRSHGAAVVSLDTSGDDPDPVGQAVAKGLAAKEVAAALVAACGFSEVKGPHRVGAGVEVDLEGRDASGRLWLFDVIGGFTTTRSGLRRVDQAWKALGRAALIEAARTDVRLILLSPDLPPGSSPAGQALKAGYGRSFTDAVAMLDPGGRGRLAGYARGADPPDGLTLPER